jgi:hypothetical protein
VARVSYFQITEMLLFIRNTSANYEKLKEG